MGKTLKELSINYQYLFTYTKYLFTYEDTKRILENKYEILKANPIFL